MYDAVVNVLQSGRRFLIVSHAHPDGDAIGSTIALGLALEHMGKEVVLFNADTVPWNLKFLPYSDRIVNQLSASECFDATIMVDVAQAERVGKLFVDCKEKGKLVCIDHHLNIPDGFDVKCLDGTAASTGDVIYRLLKCLGQPITKEIATLIFCTLVVDTGNFRYSNTTASVMNSAKELVEAGADPWEVAQNLEENNPPEMIDLLQRVLKTMEFHMNNNVATIVLTKQMLAESGASVEVSEEFINFPRSIAGVEVAVLFREASPDRFKVSLRSKKTFDVAKLVSNFGGGGHKHAAGCTIEADLATARRQILTAIKEMI